MTNAIATTTDADGAPLPWELRITAERLSLLAQAVDWDLPQAAGRPLQGAALREWCSAHNDQVSQRTAELGLGLWLAKQELGQGAWVGWCKEVGIPQPRASEAITLARLLFGAPAGAVPVLTQLSQRKLLALAPGGQDLLAALTTDGTIRELPDMDAQSIRSLVRERAETARLREHIQDLAQQRDEAVAETRRFAAIPTASRQVAALRLAALEEIERLRSVALTMRHIAHELLARDTGADEAGYDAACHAIVYGLQGLQALVDQGIADGFALQKHYTPGERLPQPILTREEEARARDWSAQFLADADLRTAKMSASASAGTTKTNRRKRK